MIDKMSSKAMLEQEKYRMVEDREAVERKAENIQDQSRGQTVPAIHDRKRAAQGPRYHAVMTDAHGAKSSHALRAYGDDEAIALALAAANGHPVEVWDGRRLVERFNAVTP